MSVTDALDRFEIRRDTLVWGALLVNTQLLLMAIYHVLSPNDIAGLTPVVVPVVWITVGLWAIVRTDPPPASQRRQTVALAVATAYFGLLGYFGGVWGAGIVDYPTSVRLATTSLPPGWAPALLANTPWIRLSVLPFQLVGYVALAYLVYATVLEAAGSAISGVLGLLSCVSCTWPVIASIVTGVVGGSAALAGVVYAQSYLLSTAVFVATVGLLYWRPGWR